MYSLGHGAHGAGVLASVGRGRPSGRARPTLPSAGHQGTAWGFQQDDSWHGVRCWRFVSCRGVGARRSHILGSPCRKWSVAVSGHRSGPCRRSGPIRAPDSGDDTEFRGGPPPRAAGPIKVRADFSFSLLLPCLIFRSTWTSTPPSAGITGLLLLFSTHTTLTPPSQLKPLIHAHGFDASCPKQETKRQLPGGYRATEHSPQTYWWSVRVPRIIYTKVPRDHSLNSSPVLPQSLFIGFSVCVCVCVCVFVSWCLSM